MACAARDGEDRRNIICFGGCGGLWVKCAFVYAYKNGAAPDGNDWTGGGIRVKLKGVEEGVLRSGCGTGDAAYAASIVHSCWGHFGRHFGRFEVILGTKMAPKST